MAPFFFGIVALIFLVIFLGIIVFVALIIFGFNKAGYIKTAKFLAISFLTILFFGFLLLMYDTFNEKKKSKEEIVKIMSYTNLKLNNDFEIIKQKEDWDLFFNRINFTLQLSDNDYINLKKQYPKNIIRDSISHKKAFVYDTLKVKIDEAKKLYFFRAHHNYDN